MATRPLVLIHGYSDKGDSFKNWVLALRARHYDVREIRVANYQSLTNEITIKDLAEGLDRALRVSAGLEADAPFDAIVHSTGGLVIRSWLTTYEGRADRLKNLIMLAPANFGSPMAHKGRSWLGAIFKGGRELGPDFLEAGDRILSGLELGSSFTWDLAHQDLVGEETFYGPTKRTPYVFVFIGTSDYGWLKRVVTEPGTDGTVRWAGCGLNCRKIIIDLTRDPARPEGAGRIDFGAWSNTDMPLVLVDGINHGTIMSDPPDALVDMVSSALGVSSKAEFDAWCAANAAEHTSKAARWQQFAVRVVDERGDAVPDYYIDFFTRNAKGGERSIEDISRDVHVFRDDASYRSFHVNLDDLKPARLGSLFMRIRATSGTDFVTYFGYGSHGPPSATPEEQANKVWDAEIDLTDTLRQEPDAKSQFASFFYPYTTTLIEIRMNREPMPLSGIARILQLRTAQELWP